MSDVNLNATGVSDVSTEPSWVENQLARLSGETQETEPAWNISPKKCAKPNCGVVFAPTGNQKFCEKHKRPSRGTPEFKNYEAAAQGRSRGKKRGEQEKKDAKYNSRTALTKSEALEVIADRVLNSHVRDVVYELGLVAAAKHDLVPNRFFWMNGLQQTLKSSQEKKEHLLVTDKTDISTEIIHAGDCFAIYDFSVSWREPELTFEQFIEVRRKLKSSWFDLGLFLGIPFEEKPHRAWADFLPQWNPEGLKPDYDLQEMREWLTAQKSSTYPVTTRDYLLQASRNTMKSTASLCLAACFVLCCPSGRLLLVSETTKLSKDFIKAFRGIWERGSNPAFERFQYFFPEYCIDSGDGKATEFTSPMRSFVLPQETAEAASLEVAVAGRRADLQLYDDVISNLNTGNHDQRQKGLNTYYALTKLREAGAGITVTLGTPWVSPPVGEVGDLYFELMRNNDEDPEHPMAVMVQPAFILKPEAAYKIPDHVLEITEEDIEELTCPSRWTFRDLMKEARKSVSMFLSQNLCMYVESEESKWTPTFTLEELQAKVRPHGFFDGKPVLFVAASVDCANSESITADQSSICIARIIQDGQKQVAFVLNVITGRWRYSQLAIQIVEAFQKYSVQRAVLERNNVPWQDLQAGIQRQAALRGYMLPQIQWNLSASTGVYTRSGISVSAKLKRAKGTEVLFDNNQLYFAYDPNYNDALFHEMVRFRGQRSGSSAASKDDRSDSLGQLVAAYLQKDVGPAPAKTEQQLEFEQQQYRQSLLRETYNQVFGMPVPPNQQTQFYTPPSEDDPGPLFGELAKYGMTKKVA
jgi:hypothetical protein